MQSYKNLFDYARYDEIVAIKAIVTIKTIVTIVAIKKNYSNYKKVETQKFASLPLIYNFN